MRLLFDKSAWDDYQYWLKNDKTILKRVNSLITECMRTPFEGTGKPEPLKYDLSGYWSRRITAEHRLVYKVESDVIIVAQCRYHYATGSK